MTLVPAPNFKYPLVLNDGFIVEAVYYGSGTLCISSQVGCALTCPFCASGKQGLKRHLSTEEMHLQLEKFQESGLKPQRLTISGIGEPLQNWENVRNFITDCHNQGLEVSVTTTGVSLPHLAAAIDLAGNGVMISLHAARPDVHRRLIPKGPDFMQLCTEIERIYPLISRRKRRKIGINYLLLSGENDSEDDLHSLLTLLQPWPDFTLHLLRYNPITGGSFSSDPTKIDLWHDYLQSQGIRVRRPNPWRNQADGGCGTLFLRTQKRKEGKTFP